MYLPLLIAILAAGAFLDYRIEKTFDRLKAKLDRLEEKIDAIQAKQDRL